MLFDRYSKTTQAKSAIYCLFEYCTAKVRVLLGIMQYKELKILHYYPMKGSMFDISF